MNGKGFFSNFVCTMFDFYGGMFRLTFFLPFVLLQVNTRTRKSILCSDGMMKHALSDLSLLSEVDCQKNTYPITKHKQIVKITFHRHGTYQGKDFWNILMKTLSSTLRSQNHLLRKLPELLGTRTQCRDNQF